MDARVEDGHFVSHSLIHADADPAKRFTRFIERAGVMTFECGRQRPLRQGGGHAAVAGATGGEISQREDIEDGLSEESAAADGT